MIFENDIKRVIRDVNDYPQPGIIFKDITPILGQPLLVNNIIDAFVQQYKGQHIDAIAAIEARGFIFGSILANRLNCKFVPIRKAGKLPFTKRTREYALEYGSASIEMHVDAISPGWRVLIHDDLLATGGTAIAAAELVESFRGVIAGFSFLINLSFLPGEGKIKELFKINPHYLVNY